MEQIEINGILWDAENLEINGKKYFSWEDANSIAKTLGKRLPTKEELQALINAEWEFDKEKKGMWFANKKLFVPMSGCMELSSRTLLYTNNGYLWLSSPKDDSRSHILRFSVDVIYINYVHKMYGLPVRLVQDKLNSPTEKKSIDIYKLKCTFKLETEEDEKQYYKGDFLTKEEVVKYGLKDFVSKV